MYLLLERSDQVEVVVRDVVVVVLDLAEGLVRVRVRVRVRVGV